MLMLVLKKENYKKMGIDMHKIIYKYGTMFSGKSLDLISTVKAYERNGYNTLILKPKTSTRDGDVIKSRLSTVTLPCILLDKEDSIKRIFKNKLNNEYEFSSLIVIDEVQFCTEDQIEELKSLSSFATIICYGLMLTSYNIVFPSINKLLTIADDIEEIKSLCQCPKCTRKATHNLLLIYNTPMYTDEAYKDINVSLDDYDNKAVKYKAVCREHYKDPSKIIEYEKTIDI